DLVFSGNISQPGIEINNFNFCAREQLEQHGINFGFKFLIFSGYKAFIRKIITPVQVCISNYSGNGYGKYFIGRKPAGKLLLQPNTVISYFYILGIYFWKKSGFELCSFKRRKTGL